MDGDDERRAEASSGADFAVDHRRKVVAQQNYAVAFFDRNSTVTAEQWLYAQVIFNRHTNDNEENEKLQFGWTQNDNICSNESI